MDQKAWLWTFKMFQKSILSVLQKIQQAHLLASEIGVVFKDESRNFLCHAGKYQSLHNNSA